MIREKDTQISRIIVYFAEAPEISQLWNEEEERYDPEKVERWSIARDNGRFFEEMYPFVTGRADLPENIYERNAEINKVNSYMRKVRKYFKEQQGLTLVTQRKNSKRSIYYYLSIDPEDTLQDIKQHSDASNRHRDQVIGSRQLLASQKSRKKGIESKRQLCLKTNMPKPIKTPWV